MAKPNYRHQKRQRETQRLLRQTEKLQKRQAARQEAGRASEPAADDAAAADAAADDTLAAVAPVAPKPAE